MNFMKYRVFTANFSQKTGLYKVFSVTFLHKYGINICATMKWWSLPQFGWLELQKVSLEKN